MEKVTDQRVPPVCHEETYNESDSEYDSDSATESAEIDDDSGNVVVKEDRRVFYRLSVKFPANIFTISRDIPNASSSDLDCCKKGYLQKLSSRSFPYIPHPWKRKYCVLVKGSLYYYEREDSRGQDKGSGVINLEYYDQVLEAPPKECKKATHVFVLTSQDRSFFDPGRHLFAAESHQSMLEWMRLLKKAIEQIRNNNRTTPAVGATAGSSSNPSSPRQKQGASKTDGLSRIGAVSKLDANSKDKGKKKESEEGTEAEKNRRRKAADEDSSTKGAADNKENLEDWTNSKERKQKFSDTSLRRRRAGNPSSQSMDESSLETNNPRGGHSSLGRKKPDGQQLSESTSAHNSLGRKQTGKGKTNSSRPSPSGQEDLLTGSLGRASLADKIASKGGSANAGSGDSGGSSTSTTNMERRKRKADDDEEEQQAPLESGPQLESVTKHRVKGPAGRRMPQNRRMQSLMMKHRASSLSALAHNAELQNQDNQSARSAPRCQSQFSDTRQSLGLTETKLNSKVRCSEGDTPRGSYSSFSDQLTKSSEQAADSMADITEESNDGLMDTVNDCAISDQAADEKPSETDNRTPNSGNGDETNESMQNSEVVSTDLEDRDESIVESSNENEKNGTECKNQNAVFVDCLKCNLCSVCRDSSNCVCLMNERNSNSTKLNKSPSQKKNDLKNDNEFDDGTDEKASTVDDESEGELVTRDEGREDILCSKCSTVLKKTVEQGIKADTVINEVDIPSKYLGEENDDGKNNNEENVELRKTNRIDNSKPIPRIETIDMDTFDDIDDALFFKASKVKFDDIRVSVTDDDSGSKKKSKQKKSKKKVTMDDKSIRETMRSESDVKSRLSRFRKTLTSFRRVRLRTEGSLSDDHPDECGSEKKSYCVIL